MNLINEALKKKCLDFLKSLTTEDKVAVIHHTDPDGVSSGVIMWNIVERLRGKAPDIRINQKGSQVSLTPETVKSLRESGITHLVSSDLVLDENPATVRQVEEFAKLCIIDHHKLYNDLNSEKTVLVKPQMLYDAVDPSQYCAAIFCYNLGSEIVDLSDMDWVAAVGVIGDMNARTWGEFLKKVLQKYEIPEKEDIFETDIGQASASISSAESVDVSNVELCFNILNSAKGVQDVLDSPIAKIRAEVEEEIKKWIDAVQDKAEFFDDCRLIWYEVNPKFNVKSQISTFLSLKYPDRAILSVTVEGDSAYISARCRDGRAMNDLLEKATKDIPGASGGGHVPASGATVPAKDLERFKQKVLEVLCSA